MNKLREISKIARNIAMYKNSRGSSIINDNAYEALRIVVKHPGVNPNYLAERVCIDKGLVSRILSQLAKKGYIISVSDPADRRFKKLFPTEKGKKLKTESERDDDEFYAYIEKQINETEKTAFFKNLDSLYEASKDLRHHNFSELDKNERHKDKQ